MILWMSLVCLWNERGHGGWVLAVELGRWGVVRLEDKLPRPCRLRVCGVQGWGIEYQEALGE